MQFNVNFAQGDPRSVPPHNRSGSFVPHGSAVGSRFSREDQEQSLNQPSLSSHGGGGSVAAGALKQEDQLSDQRRAATPPKQREPVVKDWKQSEAGVIRIEKVTEISIVKNEPMGCSGTTGAAIDPKDDDKLDNDQVEQRELTEPCRQSSKTDSSPETSKSKIPKFVGIKIERRPNDFGIWSPKDTEENLQKFKTLDNKF